MKTLTLTLGLISVSLMSFAQERAAWIGLSKIKTNISFPSTVVGAPTSCYVNEQKSYNDSLAFATLKAKVDSILILAGITIIPEDSVITAEKFKNRVAENRKLEKNKDPLKFPPVTCPSGYGPIEGNGVGGLNYMEDYYGIPASPEIVITAEYDFDLSFSQVTSTSPLVLQVKTYIYVYAYAGKKQLFKLKAIYFDPYKIKYKVNEKSCWGYDLAEDIGQLQQKALVIAIDKLDEDIDKAKEKMQKYREKKAK